MNGKKFFIFIGIIFLIALGVYFFSTPRSSDLPLIGVVDGNEVIVSPQTTGRIIELTVDEGSQVHKGDLIAKLDPKELQASLAAARANIASLEHSVHEAQHSYSWTNDQTDAAINQAQAQLTSATAQLAQAEAQQWRDQTDFDRTQELFKKGEVSAQSRDHADAALKMSQANVASLEETVKAAKAALNVAQANRKQVDVRKSAMGTTEAQLQQARATAAQVATQLGYTDVYAPLDGIVSVRVAKQGEVVSEGSPIVVVVDIDHLWVRAEVEESYIDRVQFGQKLRVQLPSGNIIDGNVIFKGVENDFATQRDVSRTKRDIKTFAIKVAIPNDGRRLFTGMTATVLLPSGQKKSWFAQLGFSSGS
jgi:HlyD family secretion protein